MIQNYQNKKPNIASSAFVHQSACIIGDVAIEEDASIWPMAVLRGDINTIKIGKRSNIQDGTVIHVSHDCEYYPGGFPVIVGDDVTVGHKVILHGCLIKNNVLIGMGSTILDGAVIEDNVVIGANSLVASNKILESGYLYLGAPVKRVRKLTELELKLLKDSPAHYVEVKNKYIEFFNL